MIRLDAIGPDPGDPQQSEALPQAPSEWYLTGFLVPYQARAEDRQDPTSNEDVDQGGDAGGTDGDEQHEKPSARRAFLPSSIGLSVLVPASARVLSATVTWGDYRYVEPEEEQGGEEGTEGRRRGHWQRTPKAVSVEVPVGACNGKALPMPLAGSDGLWLVASVREMPAAEVGGGGRLVPEGTRAVSVFLVNDREPA
ncbi:MAG: helicase, partial [Acidobacteria bacterium]|nr:helicase [Acidobacteriota bacterium]